MQSYAKDNDNGIPAATILLSREVNTWRTDMAPYLKAGLEKPKSIYERRTFLNALEPSFACPSDPIRRSGLCSYSMSAHDMSPDNWPPSSDNKTGMGLWWDKVTVSALLGADVAQAAPNRPELLPKLKLSVVSAPANTLLLTEFINRNNTMESTSFAWVGQVAQQQAAFRDDPSRFHFGKFNYLMADGHVELLTALQTGGIGDPPSGIWTIKPGD
jgi:prepilin-type processing-associated H-X9-DG protein